MVMNVEKKELTKTITKGLFALYLIFNFGPFNFISFIIAWPIVISIGVDVYNKFFKDAKVNKKRKMSNQELGLAFKIEEYLKTNELIRVNDNITLIVTKSGDNVYDRLGVFFAGEYVCQLPDFAEYDQQTYQTILTSMQLDKKAEMKQEVTLTADIYIERINEYNTDIKHQEISNYLYLTSSLLTNIAVLEKKGVSDDKKTRKLYQYYLPILMDILDNYCKVKDNSYVSEDVKAMEEKLIKTIILCNEALKTLLESLNEEDMLNLTVNMKTLESILMKDGLIKTAGMEKVKEAVK